RFALYPTSIAKKRVQHRESFATAPLSHRGLRDGNSGFLVQRINGETARRKQLCAMPVAPRAPRGDACLKGAPYGAVDPITVGLQPFCVRRGNLRRISRQKLG